MLPGFGFQGIARLKPGVTLPEANADIARMVPIWMNTLAGRRASTPIYESFRITPALRPLQAGSRRQHRRDVLWVAHGHDRHRAAHRLRERREPAARAGRGPPAGAGGARGARRGPRGASSASCCVESLLLGALGGALGLALAWARPARPRRNRTREPAAARRDLARRRGASRSRSRSRPCCGPAVRADPGVQVRRSARLGTRCAAAAARRAGSRERHRARNTSWSPRSRWRWCCSSARPDDPDVPGPAERRAGLRASRAVQTCGSPIPDGAGRRTRARGAQCSTTSSTGSRRCPASTAAALRASCPWKGSARTGTRSSRRTRLRRRRDPADARLQVRVSRLLRDAGTRLIAGRDYTWTDIYGRRPFVMVSENLARELWGNAGGRARQARSNTAPPSAVARGDRRRAGRARQRRRSAVASDRLLAGAREQPCMAAASRRWRER